MFESKVECLRCHKIWSLAQGVSEVECDCHLYCDEGSQPRDCSMTVQNYSGQVGWPVGLDQDGSQEGENVLRREYYCSIHEKYSSKKPLLLEVNLKQWFAKRAPMKFRETSW